MSGCLYSPLQKAEEHGNFSQYSLDRKSRKGPQPACEEAPMPRPEVITVHRVGPYCQQNHVIKPCHEYVKGKCEEFPGARRVRREFTRGASRWVEMSFLLVLIYCPRPDESLCRILAYVVSDAAVSLSSDNIRERCSESFSSWSLQLSH